MVGFRPRDLPTLPGSDQGASRTRLAHLPFHKTLEEFEFAFQPSIDERQVRSLASLAFAAEAGGSASL